MEYRTQVSLLGLPLVHITTERGRDAGVARGWVAVGGVAQGLVLAVGGVAVGGVAIGGIAVGVVSLAGLALGLWAVGGFALGAFAVGGLAIAWFGALGGLALARGYALGGAALAAHANDAAAVAYLEGRRFVVGARAFLRHAHWLVPLAFLPLLLLRRRSRRS